MTLAHAIFLAVDFALAAIIAFIAGWLTARRIHYDRGYRAGAARGGQLARRYFEDSPEPTSSARSRR
ncbi:MAG TPA: hypothetical protein VJ140_07845 [Actinomycetota bacterium]|nr:hypothetical protein [Actinomycetota bacterium]